MARASAIEHKQRVAKLLDAARKGLSRHRDIGLATSPGDQQRLRKANAEELQLLCDRIGARAKRRGLTEEKLNRFLSDED
jgi:hypothetical protein